MSARIYPDKGLTCEVLPKPFPDFADDDIEDCIGLLVEVLDRRVDTIYFADPDGRMHHADVSRFKVVEAAQVQILEELLALVLAAPTNHTGVRSNGLPGDQERAMPYTAKRLPDDLLARIREALGR